MKPLIALTGGEPAGIGLDLIIALLPSLPTDANVMYVGDPKLLAERAQLLGKELLISVIGPDDPPTSTHRISLKGLPASSPPLYCRTINCQATCTASKPSAKTASYVLETLALATDLCLLDQAAAIVTGPVHKGIINQAGQSFSGHTEWLQARTGAKQVVMLLANPALRVALTTTHIPLAKVSETLTESRLESVIDTLNRGMKTLYALQQPRIAVLGLNPHAGEGGHMGREEIDRISPCLNRLRAQGIDLIGPLPADTAFLPEVRKQYDVALAHYHDQGLPVLKALDFEHAINITLGLPIIRTSVDHGTAFERVGKGTASASSLRCALEAAITFARIKPVAAKPESLT